MAESAIVFFLLSRRQDKREKYGMGIDRKQIVISAIEHEETSLCPYIFAWEPESDVDVRLDAYYGSDEWRSRFRNYIVRCARAYDSGEFRRIGFDTSAAVETDLYGSVWRTDRTPLHLEEPVLKGPSLGGYRFPDPDRFFPDGWEERARSDIVENSDCFTVGYQGLGLFERAWAMRGFVELLIDAAAEPAFFADLIAAVADHQERLLDRVLAMPIDGMMFSDDWGDQRGVIIGPQRWRDVLKPHIGRSYAKAKSAGKFVLTHCCGSIADILPDVIEIGLDVLESVQPEAEGMNPYKLKHLYGDKLTFWGGLGSQSIIPFGKPDELRKEIRKMAANMAGNGGYVLACAKALQAETPTENAAAVLEEFIVLGEQPA